VWIDMADYFARPLRLTRAEALALYLRGKALAATPGLHEATALASALGKIERSLGPDTLGELTRRVEAAEAAEEALETLEVVRRAVADHERLRIDYYSASSAATRTRDVDPEEVFHAIGHWYVVAWDHLSDEERLFRADRIRAVEPIGQRFEPRGLAGAGRALYTPTQRDVSVRLRLGDDARWVAEYYEVTEAVEREDGLEVVLPASQLEWVARLVLRLGGAARVLEPDGLKDRVRQLARQTQKPYLDSSPDAV
jgi:proteasome accessory factor C